MIIERALTIQEPYCWLISNGYKLTECRSVAFPKTLPRPSWVAIHASLSTDSLHDRDLLEYVANISPEVLEILNDPRWKYGGDQAFTLSQIVGAMRVVDSIHGECPSQEEIDRVKAAYDARSERCRTDVDPFEFLSDEHHNWIIDDVYRFHRPIVCVGKLGVWSLEPALKTIVNQQFNYAVKNGPLNRAEPLGKSIIFQLPKVKPSQKKALYGVA
jgi:hypothetical protein